MSQEQEAEELDLEFIDDIEADEYTIMTSIPNNEMQISFVNADGDVLSTFTCEAADAYLFATRIMKAYDKLEGI
jgi:hypothetical protein